MIPLSQAVTARLLQPYLILIVPLCDRHAHFLEECENLIIKFDVATAL